MKSDVPLSPRQTGAAIQKSLAMITQNCITIAIAHRQYRRLYPFCLSVVSCGQSLRVITLIKFILLGESNG